MRTDSSSKQPLAAVEAPRRLLDLPAPVLSKVISLTLGIRDGHLVQDAVVLHQAVVLCRTSQILRVHTTRAITHLNLPDSDVWPNLKTFSQAAWPTLKSVALTVDRSRLISLLTWLVPAASLTHFKLTVTGVPHSDPRLYNLERHLLGKLFTSAGPGMQTCRAHGLDNRALLMSALFQCTSLTHLELGPAAPHDEPRILIALTLLLALVNRKTLARLTFPKHDWYTALGAPPSASSIAAACKSTWNVLWSSYAAGLKESAVNLPSDESDEKQVVSNFKAMSARLDTVNRQMQISLQGLTRSATELVSDDPPLSLLRQQIPII